MMTAEIKTSLAEAELEWCGECGSRGVVGEVRQSNGREQVEEICPKCGGHGVVSTLMF